MTVDADDSLAGRLVPSRHFLRLDVLCALSRLQKGTAEEVTREVNTRRLHGCVVVSVYKVLRSLAEEGFVRIGSRRVQPEERVQGRGDKLSLYRITPSGTAALEETKGYFDLMWQGVVQESVVVLPRPKATPTILRTIVSRAPNTMGDEEDDDEPIKDYGVIASAEAEPSNHRPDEDLYSWPFPYPPPEDKR